MISHGISVDKKLVDLITTEYTYRSSIDSLVLVKLNTNIKK